MDAFTTALSTLVGLGAGVWVFDTMRRRQVPPHLGDVGESLQPISLLPARSIWKTKAKETP